MVLARQSHGGSEMTKTGSSTLLLSLGDRESRVRLT